jgi:leucine dehydrogenase
MDIKVLSEAQKRGHEQVVFFHYPEVGLKAIVAIHNTVLGPALGGCRVRLYADEAEALEDVMRLSEGMTYKSALAGLNLGGGKACIIADPQLSKGRTELFLKFGTCLNHLAGRYISAEDMGTTVADVATMRKVTPYAGGYPLEEGGSGDPSPWTARGTYRAILAACERRYGTSDLSKKRVAVQGVGNVGMHLVEWLSEAGAHCVVSDVRASAVERAKAEYGATIVDNDEIYDADCDIYAPCAVGQTVNAETIPRMKCAIICGAANNQLSDSSVYSLLDERKILYCPDFCVNAGGVTSIAAEFIPGGWSESWVTTKVDGIYDTTHRVLHEAEKRGTFTEVVAVELAKERILAAREGSSE